MGQVIAFPIPPTPYPDQATDLDRAENTLLTAIRFWMEVCKNREDPIPYLLQELENAGAPDAAFAIDGLMTVVARAITRSVNIQSLYCPNLLLDGKYLLHAASLAQANESNLAQAVLRTTVLSAQDAERYWSA